MHIMWFTERAYHHVPEDEVLKLRSFFGVSNTFFDPQEGAQLLNQYLDEKIYSDELGTFDGVTHGRQNFRRVLLGVVPVQLCTLREVVEPESHHRQWVLDVVCHACRQLANNFQFLRLDQL